MAACLPEQFWARERAHAAGGDPDVALVGVVGQVGGVLQVGLGEARGREDLAHGVEVERLGRVARAGQGELVRRQGEPGAQHRDALERLVRRAREDRVVGDPHAWRRLPSVP